MERRDFLRRASIAPAFMGLTGSPAHPVVLDAQAATRSRVRPRALRPGDTVGVITPATATYQQVELDIVRESLEGLGLKVRIGRHVMDRHGSLGGTDRDRADDINRFFADDDVRAIVPTRGGWGSARLLPLLDYASIASNPKILIGYSDITALLNGIHARTGLVTFHGPNGAGRWDQTSLDWMKRVLFSGEAVSLSNPKAGNDRNVLTQIDNRTQRIGTKGGRTRGRLVGGNLSVFVTLFGSAYVPALDDAILFLEDVGEQYYRVDRMMTQLRISGALARIRGFVFGTCSECTPGDGFASLTLEEIFADHIAPLGIPAWSGAMIGHSMTQWTLPVGGDVEIDADAATLRLVEPAVT